MFSEEAINRVNKIGKIKWNQSQKEINKEDSILIYEFLRRMAQFSVSKSLPPQNPFLINIAKELGDENYEENFRWWDEDNYILINGGIHIGSAIKSYIQLAFMADKKNEVSAYLEIYEPFIRSLEKGNELIYRSGYLDITNICSISMGDWIERAELKPIDISHL